MAKVLARMDIICPKCGKTITPAEVMRVDFNSMVCPACSEAFEPPRVRKAYS
jgi:predicted RNA-binding Zn-ribbon protein involved in translation (DUF1610 family)